MPEQNNQTISDRLSMRRIDSRFEELGQQIVAHDNCAYRDFKRLAGMILAGFAILLAAVLAGGHAGGKG
ncbi:hypothetical protein [Bifidobacterium oedipodis]|uniref:Uncharacterized protein n=1 Tax=Bifidobacterium oedipodis TaxID=2675322 RepID=A0A7Y0EPC7_9BIFI|nr:hypothetical protein [Bifidobacterium sp. DSM 109957]NMM93939.1 hypothetical protein [Bifidobacterium sp. DSM 109957]